RGSRVEVYAQNMHEADSGAFTGEISAAMLDELDVNGVLLGHSERRQYFNETDAALQHKVVKALETGLAPMLCVGESEDERDNAPELMAQADIDGFLVGGASLEAESFAAIVEAARKGA